MLQAGALSPCQSSQATHPRVRLVSIGHSWPAVSHAHQMCPKEVVCGYRAQPMKLGPACGQCVTSGVRTASGAFPDLPQLTKPQLLSSLVAR